MKYELPSLPYSYDALEPTMDALTLETHYSKHHQGYVNKLNAALAKHPQVQYDSLEELLLHIDELPQDIQVAVRNNGGGHYNHSMFWNMLTPTATQPSDELMADIEKTFGSFDEFKAQFEAAGATRFGSGWVWLLKTPQGLKIMSYPNQDAPLQDGTPLLGVDVWEHAYYLNYMNKRPEYLKNIWNIVNWDYVSKLYSQA